jgi:hypothetical protein
MAEVNGLTNSQGGEPQSGGLVNIFNLWYISISFFIISILLYAYVLPTPYKEYCVLASIIFIILVAMFKFMK